MKKAILVTDESGGGHNFYPALNWSGAGRSARTTTGPADMLRVPMHCLRLDDSCAMAPFGDRAGCCYDYPALIAPLLLFPGSAKLERRVLPFSSCIIISFTRHHNTHASCLFSAKNLPQQGFSA
ncbi:hypothetical protein [Oryzomicrobium terrae]|uniref:hypothetical protein n=1 Tax=Oryzomicrobium terrae TaxID=1735038 RepID=UPI0016596568|nr:hypothetical protein [Oryzomicrobium terrae]